MKTYELEFESEICCDVCNEIIHNHFDCPICKKKCVGTSAYCDIEDENSFECEECGAEFKRINWLEWEYIGKNK